MVDFYNIPNARAMGTTFNPGVTSMSGNTPQTHNGSQALYTGGSTDAYTPNFQGMPDYMPINMAGSNIPSETKALLGSLDQQASSATTVATPQGNMSVTAWAKGLEAQAKIREQTEAQQTQQQTEPSATADTSAGSDIETKGATSKAPADPTEALYKQLLKGPVAITKEQVDLIDFKSILDKYSSDDAKKIIENMVIDDKSKHAGEKGIKPALSEVDAARLALKFSATITNKFTDDIGVSERTDGVDDELDTDDKYSHDDFVALAAVAKKCGQNGLADTINLINGNREELCAVAGVDENEPGFWTFGWADYVQRSSLVGVEDILKRDSSKTLKQRLEDAD